MVSRPYGLCLCRGLCLDCMKNVRVLKKNPKNIFLSQMYEVFDLNEAYVDVV
jgi:hypothetical protein